MVSAASPSNVVVQVGLQVHVNTQPREPEPSLDKTREIWASLVAQWLRICPPMRGTRVRALVWEDPTCRGATRPVSHNY
ncbi:hypothetical protein J1605_022555 [Eschrichtius robustus]|uniref:Uncharacterized protein n=1 Tax=Eschrichtius robustus TaxID=9764 RepID=A0AB34H641_ESCRO|nr:hypothetical protein J1605_022555 [Eschrichtius robustus]